MKKWFFISLFLLCCATAHSQTDVFHYSFGDYELTLLSEGQQNSDNSVLIDASEEILEKYASDGTYRSAVNAFLVKTPEELILFDAGFGRKLFENMSIAGVSPEALTKVYITHMHGDHIGGLFCSGAVSFPEARLLLSPYEHGYWCDNEQMERLPEEKRGNFMNARKIFENYNYSLLEPVDIAGQMDKDGVYSIEAYGHTPGHLAYMLVSRGERLLIWGDIAHAMDIQMPFPTVAVTYDVDPVAAVQSRMLILDFVSDTDIVIAGMHIPYPGIGKIIREGSGFRFLPVE